MKMARYMLVVLVVGMLFGGVLVAQEVDPDTGLPINICTQTDMVAMNEQVSALNAQFLDIVQHDPMLTALLIRMLVNSMQLYCGGKYTNETHPDGIIGPIYFDGTLYEVRFITYLSPNDMYDLGGVAGLITVEGDCGLNSANTDRAEKPDTTLWALGEGCVGMIEISSDLWELSFVKIR